MILVFKTSVTNQKDVLRLVPFLDELLPPSAWNFDLEDCDKILRIGTSELDISEYIRCYSKPGAMKTSFEYYRNILKNIDNNKVQSKIKLQVPVLALGGDKSFAMKPYHSWSAVAENVSGDIIENCGHHIAEEQPEALLQQLKLFMEW